MDDLGHLRRFAESADETASASFQVLAERLRPFLDRRIQSLIGRDSDREDVIQAALVKIWNGRHQFRPNGLGAWYLFAAKAARHCAIDFLKTENPTTQLDEIEELPGDEEILDNISVFANDRRRLFEIADEALLEVAPDIPSSERERHVLAAQLYYLHASTPREIADLVAGGPRITDKVLEKWLCDPSTLRSLGVRHLYRGNDALFEAVVGITGIKSHEALRAGRGYQDWSPLELRIATLRLRNGLLQEKISQLIPEATPSVQAAVLDKCLAKFPFGSLAQELKFSLRRQADLMTHQNVWKRLAFQYYVVDELPYKQIVERLKPAATVFGIDIDEQLLHNWFSVGRLFLQIHNYARRSNLHDPEP